jgi:hypothetical protein
VSRCKSTRRSLSSWPQMAAWASSVALSMKNE